jgi:aspartyl-tRNA(Asn)/glutamyl-tRNA(Gln) amidotransferase subunit A
MKYTELKDIAKLDKTEYAKYLESLDLEIDRLNLEYNFLVTKIDYKTVLDSKGVYACKDNFSTKDILSTGSSKILENYVPVYDATVVKKLKENGYYPIMKVALDELALGGTGMNAYTGITRNAYDKTRLAGGSSSGSTVAVALGLVPFSLGSDTGDSIRKPAALNGIVGFKPSWGRISRYGLFPFAPSLDHVGVLSNNIENCAIVYDMIKGYDPLDSTSLKEKEDNTTLEEVKGKQVGYIVEIVESITNLEVKNEFYRVIELLKQAGFTIKELHYPLNLLKAILPTYLVISCSEATSNDANLDGIKFGFQGMGASIEEQIFNTRTIGFSELVKRRFIIGSYCLLRENQKDLFLRAQKVRNLIVQHQEKLFTSVDFILTPASGDVAPKLANQANEKLSNEYLIAENHLAIGNFAGNPSLTLPTGLLNNLPLGVNINAPIFKDQELLKFSYTLEKLLKFKSGIL